MYSLKKIKKLRYLKTKLIILGDEKCLKFELGDFYV